MCGIAGLFSKSLDVSERLGSHLGDMLLQLSDRGPDSAGVAFYRDERAPDPVGAIARTRRRTGTPFAGRLTQRSARASPSRAAHTP